MNKKQQLRRLFSITSDSGTTHHTLDIKASVAYIESVFQDYQRISGRTIFTGKGAEIGPGDSDGVALMFLSHGAKRMDLADRFFSLRDVLQQQHIKNALCERHPKIQLDEKGHHPDLHRYYGENASGEIFFQNQKGYNFIVSRSVLEHVDSPATVIRSMYDALEEGGQLIHKVDLRDHGMFTPYCESVKFFEIPDFIYKKMVYGSGYPNRILFHHYQNILQGLPWRSYSLYISGLHGVDDDLSIGYPYDGICASIRKKAESFIEERKQHFCKTLRCISNRDLAVSSFFFVCEK